ncbi:hypothetical protein RHSIM_Rhsim03G0248200 [Rhododendron simsii]|uniref:SPX domain-containing protein n=1 Tax=Rhododendron simsii TaxID=118357 RepID=A0A834H5L9_RHOSS|nr:hypothetical protein RHSIM_Rhsim03G0248200 [Rhododendron simsii]
MKFGKSLSNQIEETLPEWRDKFLSYKDLKKRLKLIEPKAGENRAKRPRLGDCTDGGGGAEEETGAAEMTKEESDFIELLEAEIEKFNGFFVEKEEEYIIRLKYGLEGCRYMESSLRDLRSEDYSDDLRSVGLSRSRAQVARGRRRIVERSLELMGSSEGLDPSPGSHWGPATCLQPVSQGTSTYKDTYIIVRSSDVTFSCWVGLQDLQDRVAKAKDSSEEINIRKEIVDFHGEMVLLENYSALNYTGLVKILKKYDKRTGALIRSPYIQKVLQQPFFTTDLLFKLVKECEALLDHLFPVNEPPTSTDQLDVGDETSTSTTTENGGLLRGPKELAEIEYMESLYMKSTISALRALKEIRSKSSTVSAFSLPPLQANGVEDKWSTIPILEQIAK